MAKTTEYCIREKLYKELLAIREQFGVQSEDYVKILQKWEATLLPAIDSIAPAPKIRRVRYDAEEEEDVNESPSTRKNQRTRALRKKLR